jgi:hypothetical protein
MATAETPKRSFKRTVASTVEGRSPRFLLGSLALAMVISLVAGLAIGVKIGEHGKTAAKKTAVVVKPTPTTKKRVAGKSPFAKPPLKGTVARVTPKLLALSRGGKARIPLVLVPRTTVEATTKASVADIKPGSHVLFVLGRNTPTTPTTAAGTATSGTGTPTTAVGRPAFAAKSILIVSGTLGIRMGSIVTSVTPDSMTFKSPNGKSVTMSTVGAHVSKTTPATKALLTAGQHVLVRTYLPPVKKAAKPKQGKKARVVRRTRLALEVVILPTPSAFA